jgi:hypothetical protein
MLEYIATELAFCHGGLATKLLVNDHTIEQAVLEERHVLPFYRSVANSIPSSIEYWHGTTGPLSATEYIRDYPHYYDINHSDFLCRVKITFPNFAVVCVNRSTSPWVVSGIGTTGGWYSRNTVGLEEPLEGILYRTTTFTLKPSGGWVIYLPNLPRIGVSETNGNTPESFSLSQNFPNPCNPSTNITYELPEASNVRLAVFDLLGREVSVLVNERKEAGRYDTTFDGINLPSGVYFYRLQTVSFVETKKLLLLK